MPEQLQLYFIRMRKIGEVLIINFIVRRLLLLLLVVVVIIAVVIF